MEQASIITGARKEREIPPTQVNVDSRLSIPARDYVIHLHPH